MKSIYKTSAAAAAVLSLMGAGIAFAATGYTLFGDASLTAGNASPTGALISSDSDAPGYGGVDFTVPAGLTLAGLSTLSADFMPVTGGCGGGAPRFSVELRNPSTLATGNLFAYFGDAPGYNNCAIGVWQTTGNLLGAGKSVDVTQLGGGFYNDAQAAVAAYGAYEVLSVQAVVEASWAVGGSQNVAIDNVVIGATTQTFEPALTGESCKNGGWAAITGAPGPFKNQGQCVSSFAKAK